MPQRKRPTKSRYNNPFERIDHQFEDQAKEIRAVQKTVDQINGNLGTHRKEERDNGKRIDALTKRVDARLDAQDKKLDDILREVRKKA